MARLPLLFKSRLKTLKDQIEVAANLLSIPPSTVESVAKWQFHYLRDFFESPTYAAIYLKHLGSWHSTPLSLKRQLTKLIKRYRKTPKSSTLKLISHLFSMRHVFYEYRKRIKQPNQARAHATPHTKNLFTPPTNIKKKP